MESLLIEKTPATPEIRFSAQTGVLQIKGESYPENVAKFYTPVINWLKDYLDEAGGAMIVEFSITYFNSSSSKIFMTILEMLEKGYDQGRQIIVKWCCDPENETAIECGEEFKEDLHRLPFFVEIIDSGGNPA